jgi:predicted acyl esterase
MIDRETHDRPDGIHFTSGIFVNGVVLAGHVSAMLNCSFTGSESADYVVRLCEVYSDGTTELLMEGIERIGHNSQVQVDVGSIGRRISVGSRLRVYICSSAYPRWIVNGGYPEGDVRTPVVSEHSIGCFPGESAGSYLILPVNDEMLDVGANVLRADVSE